MQVVLLFHLRSRLHNVILALCVPAIGLLIDRIGARRVILGGTASFGTLLLLSGMMDQRILTLYLFFAALGIVAGTTSPVPYGTVISRWFDRRRGLALGIMASGLGLGGVSIPLISERLIAAFGLRAAYGIFGAAVLLLSVPIVAIFLKESPQEKGL